MLYNKWEKEKKRKTSNMKAREVLKNIISSSHLHIEARESPLFENAFKSAKSSF